MPTKVIAFYLPQYHPIKENSEWFGEGFTEWTSVGKSMPLFKGHYQPRVPADLGYYDLRVPEVREKQALLAKEAGIDAFCYYHYWFGEGRQIMEMPIEEVVKTGKPDFPFCLCWANHSFYRKNWNAQTGILENSLLLEQKYPGKEDIINHFYAILHILKDKRYYKINDRPVFVLYNCIEYPNCEEFISIWNELAEKEGLNRFIFYTYSSFITDYDKQPYSCFDGIILSLINNAFQKGKISRVSSLIRRIKENFGKVINRPLEIVEYSEAIKYMVDDIMKNEKIIPSIVPNWDVSPRRGTGATIIHNSTPELFKELLLNTLNLIKGKKDENNVIFIKSWNEWGEGNYLEPDLKYGKEYLKVLRSIFRE